MTLAKRAASHHAHCAEGGERRAEAEGDLVRFGGLATSWLRLMS
ncbi:methionyl-tRNA synthetase [Burkholderia thailandensis]|nr:methionyl-tRNA synthetase [Burkholderia thailandensis]AVR09967.1 methionyl-tRNA synthetase [Burkholderia thailandensis]AWY57309.1 methionyl-tRNA synthetase [Burkholderia thailandensis]AWY68536.1 methionyl-tRNA synthetase [Burkholderia thailandensis]KVG17911.1 methionyl-tRNA synthetase [Burkholderia thailandensis]